MKTKHYRHSLRSAATLHYRYMNKHRPQRRMLKDKPYGSCSYDQKSSSSLASCFHTNKFIPADHNNIRTKYSSLSIDEFLNQRHTWSVIPISTLKIKLSIWNVCHISSPHWRLTIPIYIFISQSIIFFYDITWKKHVKINQIFNNYTPQLLKIKTWNLLDEVNTAKRADKNTISSLSDFWEVCIFLSLLFQKLQ